MLEESGMNENTRKKAVDSNEKWLFLPFGNGVYWFIVLWWSIA